ncbi:MAG: cytochrome c oxidase subunit II [bacterium]|nr:cytochrome c oxidase subunit II [bacterium]
MKQHCKKWAAILLPLIGTTSAFAASSGMTTWLFDPVSPISEQVKNDFWYTMALIMPFMFLAHGLLIYAIVKFRAKPGGKAAKFHENLPLEIAWTAIPTLAIILIAIPAYRLLKAMEVPPKSDLVVEVVGHQFFWEYKYLKYNIGYSEAPIVVPVNSVVTLNGTSVDVIHSWFIPAIGVKFDVNPGKMTHSWFKATKVGHYKGQCAELCGKLHAAMYIDLKVVTQDEFDLWIQQKVREQRIDETVSVVADSAKAMPADSTTKQGK